jgi:DNA-binding XRE family transcriptional regulator
MNDMVTIPRCEHDRLLGLAQDLADLQSFDRAQAQLASGEEELIPAVHASRLIAGKNPLRLYRDLRGLTQRALAERAGVNRVTVAEIETGRKQGSIASLRALATALDVTLDDLTSW